MINLTQHLATESQKADGVVDLNDAARADLRALLTFDKLPSASEIKHRAYLIANLAESAGADSAMIGGAPFLMPALERELKNRGICVAYAFSVRISRDVTDNSGNVVKTSVFSHVGFVRV